MLLYKEHCRELCNLVHYEDEIIVTETEAVACNLHLRELTDVNTLHSELQEYLDGLSGQCASYRCAAVGVEEEVGSVGSNRRQVGNWPVAQRHANNGSHVGFCAKDMNWDASGLSCGERSRVELTVVCNSWQVLSLKTTLIDYNMKPKFITYQEKHTNFSHHS